MNDIESTSSFISNILKESSVSQIHPKIKIRFLNNSNHEGLASVRCYLTDLFDRVNPINIITSGAITWTQCGRAAGWWSAG